MCRIISQLENLKKEAADIQKKVEETDVVMAEVERVSQQYLPLSTSCSSLYFTLDTLNQVGSFRGLYLELIVVGSIWSWWWALFRTMCTFQLVISPCPMA